MSSLNNIHLFKCYNVNVIFCPESYSIIKTNELTYNLYKYTHQVLGISIREIMSFMKNDVGISRGTIVLVAFNKIFSLDN